MELKFERSSGTPLKISIEYPGRRKCSMCGMVVKAKSGIPLLTSNPKKARSYRDSYNVCPYCLELLQKEMQARFWNCFGIQRKPEMFKEWKKEKIIQTLGKK